MTGESYSTRPSSTISAGILPSGFCLRIVSAASVGSAFSIVTSRSRPRIFIASLILRPNGEGGEERRIIMRNNPEAVAAHGAREQADRSSGVASSAGDHEVHGLGALALLVGLDVEVDALTFVERLQSRTLDCRDVHEH